MPPMLTVQEVAATLRVDPAAVYPWCARASVSPCVPAPSAFQRRARATGQRRKPRPREDPCHAL